MRYRGEMTPDIDNKEYILPLQFGTVIRKILTKRHFKDILYKIYEHIFDGPDL